MCFSDAGDAPGELQAAQGTQALLNHPRERGWRGAVCGGCRDGGVRMEGFGRRSCPWKDRVPGACAGKQKRHALGGSQNPASKGGLASFERTIAHHPRLSLVVKRRRPRTLAVLAGTSRARSRCNPSCQPPTPRPVTDVHHAWPAGRGGRGGEGRAHQLAKACSGPPTALPILQNRERR